MTGRTVVVPSRSRLYRTQINGTHLVFSMNPAPRRAPIILYLHGGPGDACIPLTMRYNAALERDFRFINLDQRGSGLSYHPFIPGEAVTIDSIVEDVHQFVLKLLRAYGQDSLILIGHSWGSVLGLEMVKRYPSLVRCYIGLGQVVSMHAALRLRQNWAQQHLGHRLSSIVSGESGIADLVLMIDELLSRGGAAMLFGFLGRIMTYLRSPYYNWSRLLNQAKGVAQSRARLDAELEQVDFSGRTSFGAPVYFISGRYDRHLPSSLVEQFADGLESPHRFICFDQSRHCPQWDEPERFAATVKSLCL
ncbi:alpha/beta hydrolase [Bifidobacterium sp. B4107]|uniref:alpha/beta fold hydrolase n=2 Tax=Bifidobacterium TaxID=1678 RepID=UPI002B488403|nr:MULTISPECIES: alpha/beta hydrolase [unclassified Bifidobacterium]MCX8647959.1 alpha/beta hydrolase [Bifidobacterium sp. B4107]MCX8652139.1 alpha/beta hydrolase [Bifidobacterium sp. B4111]MCX8658225.1 alpha/beta hydrolase [Bifidobacterium sp. B4114]